MSVPLPGYFTPHTITIRAYLGRGSLGPRYADPRDLPAFASDEQKLIRAADGTEVVASGEAHINFDEQIPIGSLVTVWGTTERTVVAVGRHQHPTLPSYQTLSLV